MTSVISTFLFVEGNDIFVAFYTVAGPSTASSPASNSLSNAPFIQDKTLTGFAGF